MGEDLGYPYVRVEKQQRESAALRLLVLLARMMTSATGPSTGGSGLFGGKSKLIAVIGDEDTVTGFLLGGIGELSAKTRKPNFLIVDKTTKLSDIEETFKSFLARDDIGIILISQYIAEMIRGIVEAHDKSIPAILEIPSKEHPYDPAKDSVLRRARGMFSADDFK